MVGFASLGGRSSGVAVQLLEEVMGHLSTRTPKLLDALDVGRLIE
jgi:hypothetical protein